MGVDKTNDSDLENEHQEKLEGVEVEAAWRPAVRRVEPCHCCDSSENTSTTFEKQREKKERKKVRNREICGKGGGTVGKKLEFVSYQGL